MCGRASYHQSPLSAPRHRRLLLATTLGLVVALAASAPALGQASGDDALVDQYREDVPTSTGSNLTGGGGGGGNVGNLSSSIRDKLRQDGGKDKKILRKLATSSRFGATQIRLNELEEIPASPNAVSAAVSALVGAADARLIGLLVALFLITGAVLAGAARQRRGFRT